MGQRSAHAFESGPFRAWQIREGDRYELSNGHAIECMPGGRDHAGRNLAGGAVLETDPEVEWAGVDAGFSPDPKTLRAPDVAVAPAGEEKGWIPGAPPLAVEYAAVGQDEEGLQEKIVDLLAAGTRLIWVVRLVGPRRVEVYEPGRPMRVVGAGDQLQAPGILRNPVPVEALFDRQAAHRAVLRNLLQREGYESLESALAEAEAHGRAEGEVRGRAEGEARGRAEGIIRLLAFRGLEVSEQVGERIRSCKDLARLGRWEQRATTVERAADLFAGE